MLNCGGTMDVLREFEAEDEQPNSDVTFYVIDSHRPLNLDNVYGSSRVILFDDGQVGRRTCLHRLTIGADHGPDPGRGGNHHPGLGP